MVAMNEGERTTVDYVTPMQGADRRRAVLCNGHDDGRWFFVAEQDGFYLVARDQTLTDAQWVSAEAVDELPFRTFVHGDAQLI